MLQPDTWQTLGVAPGSSPDQIRSAMTRQQWDDYKLRFRIFEDRLLDAFNQGPTVDEAMGLARSSFDSSMGSTARQMGRYGLELNDRQQGIVDRDNQFARANAELVAASTARGQDRNRQMGIFGLR